jgi:hypothetical protein
MQAFTYSNSQPGQHYEGHIVSAVAFAEMRDGQISLDFRC